MLKRAGKALAGRTGVDSLQRKPVTCRGGGALPPAWKPTGGGSWASDERVTASSLCLLLFFIHQKQKLNKSLFISSGCCNMRTCGSETDPGVLGLRSKRPEPCSFVFPASPSRVPGLSLSCLESPDGPFPHHITLPFSSASLATDGMFVPPPNSYVAILTPRGRH